MMPINVINRSRFNLFSKIGFCSQYPFGIARGTAWFKAIQFAGGGVQHIMPVGPLDLKRLKLESAGGFILPQLILYIGIQFLHDRIVPVINPVIYRFILFSMVKIRLFGRPRNRPSAGRNRPRPLPEAMD